MFRREADIRNILSNGLSGARFSKERTLELSKPDLSGVP